MKEWITANPIATLFLGALGLLAVLRGIDSAIAKIRNKGEGVEMNWKIAIMVTAVVAVGVALWIYSGSQNRDPSTIEVEIIYPSGGEGAYAITKQGKLYYLNMDEAYPVKNMRPN